MRYYQLALIIAGLPFGTMSAARAECRAVADDQKIVISPKSSVALEQMHVDRALAFAILQRTSIPETRGCWGGVTGNFDGQIISAGAMQWNFGQKTLQFMLFQYRQSFKTKASFDAEISRIMPKYGDILFSDGCAHAELSQSCKSELLSHQHRGQIDPDMAAELNALFSSDAMVQIQVDRFLTILTSVGSDLKRLFGDKTPSPLKVKWAMDTKIQQGSFPTDAELKTFHKNTDKLSPVQREDQILSIIDWYSGYAGSLIQQGVRWDYKYNRDVWKDEVHKLYKPSIGTDEMEKFQLINLSFIRALRANGQGGVYQCNAFQRRATIIFGRGTLGGRPV